MTGFFMIQRFIIITLCLIFSCDAHARILSDHCKSHENTADVIECVKSALDAAQEELAQTFQKSLQVLESDEKENFRGTHNNWIAYRNSNCQLVSDREENESLKLLQKNLCLVKMTQDRLKFIKNISIDHDENLEMQGVAGLWENILGIEHPDAYWKTSDPIIADLNCNSRMERIVSGLRVIKSNDDELHTEMLLAIVEEPEIGKPELNVFKFGFSALENETNILCTSNYDLEIVILPPRKPILDTKNVCVPQILTLKHAACDPYKINWTQDGYVMSHSKQE